MVLGTMLNIERLARENVTQAVLPYKSFFELDKDLYLGTVYISPNTSQVIDQELLDDIESEIVNFTLKGDVILQGDFNARTGSMQEFAVHDDDNQFLEIPEDYEIDTENYRYSQDENTTNSRGRILIDLCTALSLRILNGRVVGDLTGKKHVSDTMGAVW